MIAFWVAAGVFSAAAAIIVLLRAAQAVSQLEPADPTPILYRRQLAEIAELADRGLIGAEERHSAEAEAGRRLLQATDAPAAAWSGALGQKAPLAIFVVTAPVLALALYFLVGTPGMPDEPFAQRLAQWKTSSPSSLAPAEIAAVLTSLIKERPHDPEGYRLLAVVEGEAQNPAGAVQALKNAVRLAPGRSDLWEMLGEALVAQSGGDVTDDARRAFLETLKTDPRNMTARFHLARAQILTGDRDGGLAQWKVMLGELAPDDPRRAALLSAVAGAEGAPAPPPSNAGPVFSAEQLTAIKGMVAGLAAKLKANPENPDGWVRLVRAYAVLGETAERDAALKAARARYAGRADVMDQLTQAAAAARLTP
ncbi:MAG TPA: c-type cytochrome biogenesis protein CcmI [Phenylobacterium sp.]|nr:c-type cytochrome biogenesis protein CcmI [Phenylobacterium sp.]